MSFEVNKAILSSIGKIRLADDTVEYITYVPTARLLEVLGYVQTTDYKLPGAVIFYGPSYMDMLRPEEMQVSSGEMMLVEGNTYTPAAKGVYSFVRLGTPILSVMPTSLRNDMAAR